MYKLFSCVAVLIAACGSSQKPFDQMTAQEHREAAIREHQLADDNFDRITGVDIEPPDTGSVGVYYDEYGVAPYSDSYLYELGDPESFIAWPRVSDPSESYEDAASEHREQAMRHERAAALLEGRPSPQPLPPPQEDQLLPDQTRDEA
jgi:hypothetical protein